MRAKNLALRVLSTAAMLSIVTSIAAPAFAATYYINEGSVDVTVSDAGVVTVKQGNDTYTDGLDSVIIRGGTRSKDETDDRIKADASPATQEADGSNTPAVNETEAPKSENTAGDTAPKPVTTPTEERKEDTPQQELTEEKTEEKVTPEPVKAKASQEPSAEQEKEEQEKEEQQEEEPTTDSSAAPLAAAPATQADNSSTSTPVQPDTPADNQNTAGDDVSTPKLYVIDLASTQVLFDETRQDDTVTYTTKQDGASLTGSFEALEAMAADGVKTIVFQTIGTNTPGAVSRVSVNALLQHGGETLLLTHNGTEVHLTIDGQNADSLLLQ